MGCYWTNFAWNSDPNPKPSPSPNPNRNPNHNQGAKGESARALAELAAYLAPEGELRAYGSAAEYARARLRAAAPAAHIFVQARVRG